LAKGVLETVTEIFKPQVPLWACELTSKHIIAAGVNSRRTHITDRAMLELPEKTPIAAVRPQVRSLFDRVGFRGSEIVVVVPDEGARISLLTAENPSKAPEEQQAFIRWKLKKTVPFDVDTAQVAYRLIGPNRTGPGVDMLVALSPRSTVEEYEKLFDSMDIHAGMVLPSTLAALNLFAAPMTDALFVKVAPECMTTTVFQGRRIQFYRRVTDMSLYDAVYPTIMYYQDKLGGKSLEHMVVCGYDLDLRAAIDEIREKLGISAQRLEPKSVDDIYKPALGAVHLKAESVL
jgi:type IV pilus assembly protein PilM